MRYRWYVLSTHYQQENRARHNLTNQRIANLLPLARTDRRNKDGDLVARLDPLFPGYIFTKIRLEQSSTKVLSTRGVKAIVGYNEDCSFVPYVRDETMVELKAKLHEYKGYDIIDFCVGKVPRLPIKANRIKVDILVHLLFGPFQGHTAKVTAVKGSCVDLVLNLLGKDVTLEAMMSEVQAAA